MKLALPLGLLGAYCVATMVDVVAYVLRDREVVWSLRSTALAIGLLAVVLGATVRVVAAARRRDPAGVVVRPRPAVPVSRGFRDQTRLVVDGRTVTAIGADAERHERVVTKAVVLEKGGRPWALELHGKSALPLLLPWDAWFGGDRDAAAADPVLSVLDAPVETSTRLPHPGNTVELSGAVPFGSSLHDIPFGVETFVVGATTLALSPLLAYSSATSLARALTAAVLVCCVGLLVSSLLLTRRLARTVPPA